MLRKFIIGAILTAAAGAAAPALADPVPLNWTGFYAGLNGGYGGDRFEYPFSATLGSGVSIETVTGHAHLTSSGFLGGGQVGFNFEPSPNWLLGVEGDIDATDIKGEIKADYNAGGSFLSSGSVTAGSKLNYLATLRARSGYVGHSLALYATGGLAFGEVRSHVTATLDQGSQNLFSESISSSHTHTGWTAGAGFEYAINNRVTLKTEYMYVDLGRHTLIDTPFSLPQTMDSSGSLALHEKTTAHIVRAGINWHF